MKKRLKKILGIGILVPILFLVIGLNIKPKCVTFDVLNDLNINDTNRVNWAVHIITEDVVNRTTQQLFDIEWITEEGDYRQFRMDYDYVNHKLFLIDTFGTSVFYDNTELDTLFLIISLANVGQDIVILDYYLSKIVGNDIINIDNTSDFEWGYGRFRRDNLLVYTYNSATLSSFGGFSLPGVSSYRQDPYEFIREYVFNFNDVIDKVYTDGFTIGHTQGYNEGLDDAGAFADNLWFFTPIISGISSLLAIQIYPNVSIGTFLLIPLALGIIALILVFWRKD